MKFEICESTNFHLRMGLIGPAGSGKTYTALQVATEFGCGKVGIIDTEAKSARRYAKLFSKPFFSLELERFSPSDYIQAIEAAEQAGIEFLVIDSLSHAWAGRGGVLDLVDLTARKQARGGTPNSFSAWREVTPEHNRLVDTLLRVPMHLIVTMRTKTEYVVEQNEKGKSIPRKIGLAPIQREGLEYEFDLIGELSVDHELSMTKTRCPALADEVLSKPGKGLAETLRAWVDDSADSLEEAQTAQNDWVARISDVQSLEELESIRVQLNQGKQNGARFEEAHEKQIRMALKEAQERLQEEVAC